MVWAEGVGTGGTRAVFVLPPPPPPNPLQLFSIGVSRILYRGMLDSLCTKRARDKALCSIYIYIQVKQSIAGLGIIIVN